MTMVQLSFENNFKNYNFTYIRVNSSLLVFLNEIFCYVYVASSTYPTEKRPKITLSNHEEKAPFSGKNALISEPKADSSQ
jgi:hypothetical protein